MANFTFFVDRDEAQGDTNLIWINWGIFDDPSEWADYKVDGSYFPYTYSIDFTYNDFFDRIFLTNIWIFIFICSFFGPFALPIQAFPVAILLLYVYTNPLAITLFVTPS